MFRRTLVTPASFFLLVSGFDFKSITVTLTRHVIFPLQARNISVKIEFRDSDDENAKPLKVSPIVYEICSYHLKCLFVRFSFLYQIMWVIVTKKLFLCSVYTRRKEALDSLHMLSLPLFITAQLPHFTKRWVQELFYIIACEEESVSRQSPVT